MADITSPDLFLSKTGFRKVTAGTNANLTGPITSVGNATTISTSIALPGSPTTTTQTLGTNNTTIATTAFVEAAVAAVADDDSAYFLVANVDTDDTLSANSDAKVPSQKAVKDYVDDAVGALSGAFIWNEVTGPTAMLVNNGYIANNSSLVVLTLPVTATQGNIVRVAGKGAGGWQVAQNSGQTIHFISSNTTTGAGGSISSQEIFDAVEILCTANDTNWTILTANGNITIV